MAGRSHQGTQHGVNTRRRVVPSRSEVDERVIEILLISFSENRSPREELAFVDTGIAQHQLAVVRVNLNLEDVAWTDVVLADNFRWDSEI